jgi:signal transduction histidine kinase/ligand-binding sensor domain-containing protein
MLAASVRFWKTAAPVCFLVCGWLACATAMETSTDWFNRVWQVDDGLPAANVTGIAQTHDGYLWIGTQSGLARFDGVNFEVVPIPVGSPRPTIRVMLCDHAENFWMAEKGGSVICFNPNAGTVQELNALDGLPAALALQMIETPDHAIWISYTDNSVYRISPDNKVVRITAADGLNDDGTCSLTLDARGVLWFAKGLQYGFLSGKRFVIAGTLSERNPQILSSRNGGIWICTSSQLLRIKPNTAPVTVARFEADSNRMRPSVLFEDSNGRLWIGTASDGLFQLDHTNLFKIETSQNKIRTVIQDRENNIWVGTDGGGLNRLQPKVVELIGRDEGLPFETVRSMAEDRAGNFWVITQDGALTKLPGDDWASGQRIENWPGGLAHCVVSDNQGAMWIGTYQHGLFRWQDGIFSRFDTRDGLGEGSVRSLMVDSRSNLWIGLDAKPLVQRFHDGTFQSFELPANSRAVSAMVEDSSGQVWMGTLDGQLLRVDGDGLVKVTQPNADQPYPIRCLSATPDGSLWIGYAVNGVCRLKAGNFSHIGPENGLFDGNICALMPDNSDRMWFASDRGIFLVSLIQLIRFADRQDNHVQSIFYSRDAGLPSLQAYYGYWPGAITTASGEILFPTHSGIAVVYPDHVRPNRVPPIVLIRSILVDGNMIPREGNKMLKLPPNHRRIEISFTAPSFIAPKEVRFRYRLAGWSDDWTEVERGNPAVFSRLPPGHYTFKVTACNNYGVWSEKEASIPFFVTPFFWQSLFFRIPAFLIFTAILVAVVRHTLLRHFRKIIKRAEQEAALQKERTRIAQDMHDELGARFTQISLLGELSRNALAEPDKAQDFLCQISRVAQIGVKSLDEIVWAVNPRNDTLTELLDYTGQYALDFVKSAGLQCWLDFPDAPHPREISGEIRHAVFLIVKESLHNVVKHAQATRVNVVFETTENGMLWRIEDNGKGFDLAPDNANDDGLRNIQQRAAALGGHADIMSQAGKGTRIAVRIPLFK